MRILLLVLLLWTRADFWVGRGRAARWVGSIAMDGFPEGVAPEVLSAKSEQEYEHALRVFFAGRDDVSGPDHGWPWPWEDSTTTDYAYAFEAGKVWAHGCCWFDPLLPEPEDEHECPGCGEFPDMSEHARVTLGRRSGLLTIPAEDDA